MQIVDTRPELGWFQLEEKLTKKGYRVYLLADGNAIVLRSDVAVMEIKRPAGRLPSWPQSTLDLVDNWLGGSGVEDTPEQIDLFCRSVTKEKPLGDIT